MVTRIVPATVASFGVIFAIVIITRHAPPKHLVAVLRAPGSAAATNIEFNPDGTLLATVSCSGDCGGAKGDDQVDIWNLATRHVATVFDYPGQNEFGSDKGLGFMPLLSFSPDGDSLVTTSTASPIIYLISSAPFGAKVTTFESPDGNSIEALEFSPDGKSLITTNGSENAYLWSTATRKIEAKFTDHRQYAAITSTSFSSRGTIVAFGDDKDDIYAWNFVTGTTVSIQNTAYDGVSPIGIDSLGRTLAIADGFGEIQLFSLGAEKVIATLNIPAEIFGIEAVAFSADGKIIAAAGDDGNIYFWDTATKRMIGTLADGPTSFFNPTPPELATMAFSPNGKILATDDSDGNVYIWDISWLHA